MKDEYTVPSIKPRDALVLVCVDEWTEKRFTGTFYHLYLQDAFPFSSQMDLMIQMDWLFDELNHPQSYFEHRGARKKSPAERQVLSVKAHGERRGAVSTFYIHILQRQNATWQGTLWLAGRQGQIPFRSVLELARILDSEEKPCG